MFEGGKIPVEGAATVRSIWTDHAVQLRSKLPPKNPQIPTLLAQEILHLPSSHEPAARRGGGGLLITTEPGIEIPAVLVGSGPRAVIWISERDVASEALIDPVLRLAQQATVLVVEPRCMSIMPERELANQGAVLMGRPLVGMWAFDVLRAAEYLRDQRGFNSISIAASGVYPGLAALLAVVLEPRIERAAIDGMFSSFVSIVGRNWIAEIPGILRIADIDQLVAVAGAERVVFNNLQSSPVPVNIRDHAKPFAEFFSMVLL